MANKGFMDEKKQTAAQMERRLNNALIHVDLTKNTRSIYFSDKGLRLTDTDEHVLIQTGFHSHVFSKLTNAGYSRPCLYVARFIDIALSNEEYVEESKKEFGYSYERLFEVLKAKEDKTEFNIATYVDWWLSIIFAPLYAIDENAASQFNVYYKYLSHIATQHIFLSEHKDGMTNKQFIEEHDKLMKELVGNITEQQIFVPLSDEERMKQEMEAMQEQEVEQQMQS